jgi:diguanylate cyclase (GGDEF)-like protein
VKPVRIPAEIPDDAAARPAWELVPLDGGVSESMRVHRLEHELEVARETIHRIATSNGIDTLTGLLNRDAIGRCIDLEIKRAHRHQRDLAVLLVDVDRLGAINEVKGHERGDEVLRTLAQHIRDATRATDSVGRARSDEFLVVCPETDAAGAVRVAQTLIGKSARRVLVLAGSSVHLSCCIGIVPVVLGMTLADVLGAAQAALERAKKAGSNRWSM